MVSPNLLFVSRSLVPSLHRFCVASLFSVLLSPLALNWRRVASVPQWARFELGPQRLIEPENEARVYAKTMLVRLGNVDGLCATLARQSSMFCACDRDEVDVMSKDCDDDTYAGCK